jgi:hypothetical protein
VSPTGLWTLIGFTALGIIIYMFAIVSVYRSCYRKVGPHEIMVISGGPGSFITGIWKVEEIAARDLDRMGLEFVSFAIRPVASGTARREQDGPDGREQAVNSTRGD